MLDADFQIWQDNFVCDCVSMLTSSFRYFLKSCHCDTKMSYCDFCTSTKTKKPVHLIPVVIATLTNIPLALGSA